eukprot:CAMPEP_0185840284 /NCGR_PEP_ID=MMETSP1353-20130828/15996_1 /TAXON_ID=1077150 /ORGANISM="Erythrolobus australicus, Strain CCMP3124" /LENGTH=130 /DNA_ID=CAMNT_0028539599 /DNA_START=407 /DNA_END=796 /DNA_ORIENTATION=+
MSLHLCERNAVRKSPRILKGVVASCLVQPDAATELFAGVEISAITLFDAAAFSSATAQGVKASGLRSWRDAPLFGVHVLQYDAMSVSSAPLSSYAKRRIFKHNFAVNTRPKRTAESQPQTRYFTLDAISA